MKMKIEGEVEVIDLWMNHRNTGLMMIFKEILKIMTIKKTTRQILN